MGFPSPFPTRELRYSLQLSIVANISAIAYSMSGVWMWVYRVVLQWSI